MQESNSWKIYGDLLFKVRVYWQYSDKSFNPSAIFQLPSEVVTLAILASRPAANCVSLAGDWTIA